MRVASGRERKKEEEEKEEKRKGGRKGREGERERKRKREGEGEREGEVGSQCLCIRNDGKKSDLVPRRESSVCMAQLF